MKLLFSLLFILILIGCGENSGSSYKEDPLKKDQWHLDGIKDGYIDINLQNSFYKGRGVLVAIIDNGIDIYHEDLKDNIGIGSYSYLTEEYSFTNANHGTCCAGIIAGVEGNGKGIRGIAPQAEVIGYNALKAPSISNIADAFVRNKEKVSISNNSWGDFNSWGEPLSLRSIEEDALKDGVKYGRNGKGIIYVFSAGNGSADENSLPTDNVNYSGLVNNRYTIPVGAVDEFGKKTHYSEIGATLIVVAPSKGSIDGAGIVTTDVTGDKGYNPETFQNDYEDFNYTKNFSGTSASAPIVSGVVALISEANPNLSWRDVRIILAQSATKNDIEDSDWSINGANLHINHKYGFGLINTKKAIDLALNWKNVPEEKIIEKLKDVNISIPDNNDTGVSSSINIEQNISIEFIDIYFNANDHQRLGDLEITLMSPYGTKSILAEKHGEAFEGSFRYNNWRFGTMRHLNEYSEGEWKLIVKDLREDNNGTFISWGLKFYGH